MHPGPSDNNKIREAEVQSIPLSNEDVQETLTGDLVSALGNRPEVSEEFGNPINDEVVLRWTAHLTQGLSLSQGKELMDKIKILSNWKVLVPPQINPEVLPTLPDTAIKYDKFMTTLQQQLAHAL